MTKVVRLRAKIYSYLINDDGENKKPKKKKKNRKLKFEKIKNCLEATQLENKINYLESK